MQYTDSVSSPLGMLTLASDGENITGLWLQGQKYFAATLEPSAQARALSVFVQTRRWLDIYFSGEKPNFLPPLAPQGSAFRQTVWRTLCEVPYGETITYGQIARRLQPDENRALPFRAVGGAVGRNPISILIPCHRAVGSNGNLTGYAGGIDRKIWLLRLEQALLLENVENEK